MSRRAALLLAGALLSIIVVAVLLGASDLGELRARAASIAWRWGAVGAALAVLSYACIAATQHALLTLLGARVPRALYLRLSMVSVVVARTLRSGGTSGLAFLAVVLSRHGVPVTTTLSMGLGAVMVNACVATAFVLAGFLLLLLHPSEASRTATIGYGIGTVVLVSGVSVAWFALVHEPARARLLRRIESVAEWLGRRLRKDAWGRRAHEACSHVSSAAREVLGRPAHAWHAWTWAVVRLAASVLSLGACAKAVGISLPLVSLLLAFTAMKLAGTMAMVPAGLGIVDGSLAGVLTLLGVPYEASLLVAALHRVAYHVVPAVVALMLAGPLLRDVVRARQAAAG